MRDGVKVRFPFTISEVRSELLRVKHEFKLSDIKEAIVLLNEVRITIEELGNRSSLLSAAAFPRHGDEVGNGGGRRTSSSIPWSPTPSGRSTSSRSTTRR